MRWPYPRIVAHRGGGGLAPENTLAAIRLGASLGFRGVEFDLMLSGDGTPVLIHDETLERTTGAKGEVARTPYAELAKLDAGAWRGERWRGERIPTFRDAGELCRTLGVWANVEIKPAKGHERATGASAGRMARELWKGAALAPVLSSFSVAALEAARAAAPELPRGFLVDEIPADWKRPLESLECVSLHCNGGKAEENVIREVRAAGYAVVCWTVNEPAEARMLLGWGVDCLATDALDVIGPDFAK